MKKQYSSFKEFWPFYLGEHKNVWTRRLHFIGGLCALIALTLAVAGRDWRWLLLIPVGGYGFAWLGHFVIEKNRPATFKYPFRSLQGDIYMFLCMLFRRKLD